MIPNFNDFNPKKMKGIMKQLGIEMIELKEIKEVIIKCKSEDIIIKSPSVSLMKANGIETYQISNGSSKIINHNNTNNIAIKEEDISFICDTTGVSREKAEKMLLKNNGDIAETINYFKNINS